MRRRLVTNGARFAQARSIANEDVESMIRSLHQLMLLLGQPSVRTFIAHVAESNLMRRYRWQCGCEALGKDVDALTVRPCESHDDLLNPPSAGSFAAPEFAAR